MHQLVTICLGPGRGLTEWALRLITMLLAGMLACRMPEG